MTKYKDKLIRRMDRYGNLIGPWMYVIKANSSFCETIIANNTNIGNILRNKTVLISTFLVQIKNVFMPKSISLHIPKPLFKAIECGKQKIIDFDLEDRYMDILNEFAKDPDKPMVIRFNSGSGKLYASVENVYIYHYKMLDKRVIRVELKQYLCTL